MAKRFTIQDVDMLQGKGLKIINTFPAKKAFQAEPQQRMKALGRLKQGTMNKTEAAYARLLEARKSAGEVAWYAFEAINLRLADKCFYKVDFLVMLSTGDLEAHECKGYWTDDALVKIKTAAEKFPFRFKSVRLNKGQWEYREF